VIVVNGEPRERDGATIAELLADLGVEERGRGVAVAVNGEVVPRTEWARRRVGSGDRVEALSAMQGGWT
jgi:sulfur carrier protein